MKKLIISFILIFNIQACASSDGVRYSGHFKVGKPYVVLGQKFYPEIDTNYDERGVASWYGDEFHNRQTANGEVFKKGDMTAAHPTLPLPSIVKVTNLENGKSVKVRLNDRGPFKKNRIIDLSERAAEKLGFSNQGTAEVRVRFLKKDTDLLHERLFGQRML